MHLHNRTHLLSCVFFVTYRGFLKLNKQWTLNRYTQTNKTMSRQASSNIPPDLTSGESLLSLTCNLSDLELDLEIMKI